MNGGGIEKWVELTSKMAHNMLITLDNAAQLSERCISLAVVTAQKHSKAHG